jgi:hypothetical protein
MTKFRGILCELIGFLDSLIVALLFVALTFFVGYHMGFKIGLDTKVTIVGEKYTMKVTGNGKR